MAGKNYLLKMVASPRVVQVLIGLLFISMGIIGFSTNQGLSGDFAKELGGLFGNGNSELVRSGISTLLLACGLILLSALFVRGIPVKFVLISKIVVLSIWLVLIIVLDLLAVSFGNMDTIDWCMWIEQIVLHLIVLVSIITMRESL